MIEPTAHMLRSARLDLNWWRWGAPDAPLMILIHGGRDHARSWDAAARAFAGGWQVIAPDLRGHGQSQWSDGGAYQMEDFVYDLDRLAEELGVSAEAPATIVGHSLGGNIGLRWTALHPERVRRLVVIEGLGPSPKMVAKAEAEPMAERLRGWIAQRRRREERALPVYPDLAAAEARMKAAHPGFSDALAAHLTRHGVRAVEGGVSFAHDPLLLAWPVVDIAQADKEALWRAIACPVLLLYGRQSWASNPAVDGRAGHFRDATVRLFDGGHWLHHEREDEFLRAVAEFVA